jgi:putative ABC transport system permease protein
VQDLRLAIRALCATPIVSGIAILSLALGIGANTAIFSLVNSLLLRSLPVAAPRRLAVVASGSSSNQQQYSYATFDQIRRRSEAFQGALAWAGLAKVSLTRAGETQTVDDAFVSGDYFTTLGVPALVGRTFTPSDDVRGGGPDGPVVMISYQLWQRRFGGATNVVGTRVIIERAPMTIVGVTPPDFFGVEVGRTFDVALPIRTFNLIRPAVGLDEDAQWLRIMVRLKPGQSLGDATAALRAAQPAIRTGAMTRSVGDARAFLKDPLRLEEISAGVSPLRERFEQPLVMLVGVVLVVLLIACANIANLLLVRGIRRQHELSVRLALGATRWRLIRLFLIESVVLASIGTIVGLALAVWASRAMVTQLSTSVNPVALSLPLDWRVLACTGAILVATALLSGTAPALRATHLAPVDALKDEGRTIAGGPPSALSSWLTIAQVALSLILVMAAGLFIWTFDRLTDAPLGFDRDDVVVATLSAPTVAAADRNLFYHQLVRAVSAVSGVAHAGGSISPPLISHVEDQLLVTVPGPPRPDAERRSRSNYMTPGWLEAYGTRLHEGRQIDAHDSLASTPVMMVNEEFARRFLPSQSAIGQTIAISGRFGALSEIPIGRKTIVGVVADAVYSSVREGVSPTMYFPLAQVDEPIVLTNFHIAVRSSAGSPMLLTRAVAAALTAVNHDLNVTFRPLAEQVTESLAQDRLVAAVSGFFGTLALLLAAIGLYGVTACTVARRRTEIGIRRALGASATSIIGLVLSRVSVMIGVGVAVGVLVSLWISTFVASLLYGVNARDPATYVGAAGLLALTGMTAAWWPAYRASRMDPAEVIRDS